MVDIELSYTLKIRMASSSLALELECSVCLDTPKVDTKVFQCCHGHLLCEGCHLRLTSCPTCKRCLYVDVYGENDEDPDGLPSVKDAEPHPIRCLLAEKIIHQLPTIDASNVHTVQSEMEQVKIGLKALNDRMNERMKEFNDTVESVDKKLLEIQNKHKEKRFLIDEYGYTQVYVAATADRYGVFWGPEREDINFLSPVKSGGSSASAACKAIAQAHDFGISRLSVIMYRDIVVYSYIQNLSAWKKSGWKHKNQWIPHACNLKALDATLMMYQDIAVRFTGSEIGHPEHSEYLKSVRKRCTGFHTTYSIHGTFLY